MSIAGVRLSTKGITDLTLFLALLSAILSMGVEFPVRSYLILVFIVIGIVVMLTVIPVWRLRKRRWL